MRPTRRVRRAAPATLDDEAHRLVPVGLDQLAALADERPGQPVRGVVRLPAEEALRPEPPVVDPISGPAAHPDDPAVVDGDIQPAPLEWSTPPTAPTVDGVDTLDHIVSTRTGHCSGTVRRPRTPRLSDPIDHGA